MMLIVVKSVSLLLGLKILTLAIGGAEKLRNIEVKNAKLCQTQLAQNVIPLEYDIQLNFLNGFASIRGEVTILNEFSPPRSKSKSTMLLQLFKKQCKATSNEILLHLGRNLEISGAKFQFADSVEELKSGAGSEIRINRIARDDEKQMISIKLERDLSSSSIVLFGRLEMAYESRSPDPSLFVATNWQDTASRNADEHSHWLARLQFGQVRNLLPCFDEPQLKTRIKLKVVTTNTEVDFMTNLVELKSNRYESTSPMPIGGLVLGFITKSPPQFFRWRLSPSSRPGGGVRVSVSGPKSESTSGDTDGGQWALDFASRCLEWLQESVQINYPFEGLRLVAVPPNIKWNISDGPGFGFVNGKYLLRRKIHANDDERQRVAAYEQQIEVALNVALVVARQWFGWGLVPNGWSNLWICEGLAARAALQMVQRLEPMLNVYQYVRLNYLKRALVLDDDEQFPPISSQNQAQDQHISPAPFDLIRLVKAAAIMQMLEKTIASDLDFDQVISLLIKRKSSSSSSFGSIDLHELAEAFSNNVHGRDKIQDLLRPWVELSGFPTFEVITENDLRAISVRQLPTMRLDTAGRRVEDRAGQWPVSLKFDCYSQINLQSETVDLYETINDNKLARHNSKSSVRIELPNWLRNAPAKIGVLDDYQTLPYYKVDCSKSGISCRETVAGLV